MTYTLNYRPTIHLLLEGYDKTCDWYEFHDGTATVLVSGLAVTAGELTIHPGHGHPSRIATIKDLQDELAKLNTPTQAAQGAGLETERERIHRHMSEAYDEMVTCNHIWKRYVGFTDVYDYCLSCDEKRNI